MKVKQALDYNGVSVTTLGPTTWQPVSVYPGTVIVVILANTGTKFKKSNQLQLPNYLYLIFFPRDVAKKVFIFLNR